MQEAYTFGVIPDYVSPALLSLIAKHAPTELEVFEKLLQNVGCSEEFLHTSTTRLLKVPTPPNSRRPECLPGIISESRSPHFHIPEIISDSRPHSRQESPCGSARLSCSARVASGTGKKNVLPRPESVPRISDSPSCFGWKPASARTATGPKASPSRVTEVNHPVSRLKRPATARLATQSPAGTAASPRTSRSSRKKDPPWELQLRENNPPIVTKEPSSSKTNNRELVKEFDKKWRAIMLEKQPARPKKKVQLPPWDSDVRLSSYDGVGPWFGSPTSKQQEMDIPLKITVTDVVEGPNNRRSTPEQEAAPCSRNRKCTPPEQYDATPRLTKREPIIRRASWKNGRLVRRPRPRRSLSAIGLFPRPKQQKAAEKRMKNIAARRQRMACKRLASPQKFQFLTVTESLQSPGKSRPKTPEATPEVKTKPVSVERTGLCSQRSKPSKEVKDSVRKGPKRKDKDEGAGKLNKGANVQRKDVSPPKTQHDDSKRKSTSTTKSLIKTLAMQLIERLDAACSCKTDVTCTEGDSRGSSLEAETVVLDYSCGVPFHQLHQEKPDLSEVEQAGIIPDMCQDFDDNDDEDDDWEPIMHEEACQTNYVTRLSTPCQTFPDTYLIDVSLSPQSQMEAKDAETEPKFGQTTGQLQDFFRVKLPVADWGEKTNDIARTKWDPLSVINLYTRQKFEENAMEGTTPRGDTCTSVPDTVRVNVERLQPGEVNGSLVPQSSPRKDMEPNTTKPTDVASSTCVHKRDTTALWRKLSAEIQKMKRMYKHQENANKRVKIKRLANDIPAASNDVNDAENVAAFAIRENDGSDSDVFTFHHARKRRKNRKGMSISQEAQKIDWLEKNVLEKRREAQQWRLRWKRHLLETELRKLDDEICQTRTRIETSQVQQQQQQQQQQATPSCNEYFPEPSHVMRMKAFLDVPSPEKAADVTPRTTRDGIDSVVDSTIYSDSFVSDHDEPLRSEEKKVPPAALVTDDHRSFWERTQNMHGNTPTVVTAFNFRVEPRFEAAISTISSVTGADTDKKQEGKQQVVSEDRFKKELSEADRTLEQERLLRDRSQRKFWEYISDEKDVVKEELDCEPTSASDQGAALTVSSEEFVTSDPGGQRERNLATLDYEPSRVDDDVETEMNIRDEVLRLATECKDRQASRLDEVSAGKDGDRVDLGYAFTKKTEVMPVIDENVEEDHELPTSPSGLNPKEDYSWLKNDSHDFAAYMLQRQQVQDFADFISSPRGSPVKVPTTKGSRDEDSRHVSTGEQEYREHDLAEPPGTTYSVSPPDEDVSERTDSIPGESKPSKSEGTLEDDEAWSQSGYSDVDEFEEEGSQRSSVNKAEEPKTVVYETRGVVYDTSGMAETGRHHTETDGSHQPSSSLEEETETRDIEVRTYSVTVCRDEPATGPKLGNALEVDAEIPEEILVDELCSSTGEDAELTSEGFERDLCCICAAFEGGEKKDGDLEKLELGMEAARLVEDRLEHELEKIEKHQNLADRRMTDVLFTAVLQDEIRGHADSCVTNVEGNGRGLNKAAPLTKMAVTDRLQKKNRILPDANYSTISLDYVRECVDVFLASHNPEFTSFDQQMKQHQDFQLGCFNRIIFDCINEFSTPSNSWEKNDEDHAASIANKIMGCLPSSERMITIDDTWQERVESNSIVSELCDSVFSDLVQELIEIY